jgi:hypothetical protein
MMNDTLFHAGFANQPYAALGQGAQTAMEQAAGPAACAVCDVVLLNQGDFHAAHCGVAGHRRSHDASADHEDIEPIVKGVEEVGTFERFGRFWNITCRIHIKTGTMRAFALILC